MHYATGIKPDLLVIKFDYIPFTCCVSGRSLNSFDITILICISIFLFFDFLKDMVLYWSNFHKYGNPNGLNNDTGLPFWPTYPFPSPIAFVPFVYSLLKTARLHNE